MPDFGMYNVGMFSYNAILYAIALAGGTCRDFLWMTLAILHSVALQWFGMAGRHRSSFPYGSY